MRLGLFDRIRRLVHPRRSGATGTVPQGRHRRGQRRSSGSGPSAGAGKPARPDATPGSPSRPAALPPDEWPAPDAAFAPDAQPAPDAAFARHAQPAPDAAFSRDAQPAPAQRASGSPGAQRGSGSPAVRVGGGRARIREAPDDAAVRAAPRLPPDRHQAPPPAVAVNQQAEALARAAAGIPHQAGEAGPSRLAARAALRLSLPFTAPHARERPVTADGRRNCGSLETILWRQWDADLPPPPEVIEAVDRLAELPEQIKERLADGLDAIFIGRGGVPELDEMTALRGVRLPSGQASWDACAGAYGERKIVVGSQPSPTPDVMCHEVGHALDDLDSPPGKWQSDSAEFRMIYDQCQPHLASDFHRQPGGLGRKEFFADAFAAIASGQRPALVDMLSGDTRTALRVMLYFNRRYGI
jgi:hypothetical protein